MSPTLILKFIGGSVGLGGGITGSVFSSFQAFTKISIEEFLKDDWATYSENSEWQILKKKLDDSQNTDEKNLGLTELKEVKNAENDTNGTKNKNWCSTKKSFKIKKLLPSSFESLLLSYIKDFCILTIGEKLTPSKQFTDWSETDRDTLKANAKKLENRQEGTDGNINGIKELEEIKSKDDEDNKGKDLLVWCQKTYKRTYKGSTDNLWKLADYYCKKTTSPGK